MPNGNDFELKPENYIKPEDNIDPSQSIVDGPNHFLIGEGYDYDGGMRGVVRYVQGARVKADNLELKNFEWDNSAASFQDRKIKIARFYVNKRDYKLSDIFETTPWGVIKKNRTGIGATTLELRAERNSIIVVPTKALAVSKVKSTGFIEGTEKYKCYYVGSPFEGFTRNPNNLGKYLYDKEIQYKKFVVVSDSLGNLIKGIENLGRKREEFFLLVDEIDSYQYDNTYRPNMEKVIDYYFTFPWYKRCMLSATVSEFSNPQINEEPFFELIFIEPPVRNINLIPTLNICAELAQYIKDLCVKYPEDKILIAYNSITNIMSTINLLDNPLSLQCAVYCSEKSIDKPGEYYAEFSEDRLQNRINFITCTYFVGIDILDQYHLISVSDVSHLYSVLSIDKFTQIAGRCRHEGGLLSETLIYKTFTYHDYYDKADMLHTIFELTECLIIGNNPAIDEYFKDWGYDIDSIVKRSKFYYNDDTSSELLREDIDGKLARSYLNIDAFLILKEIKHKLYTSPQILQNQLSRHGHKIEVIEAKCKGFQLEAVQARAKAIKEINQNQAEAIDLIVDELRQLGTIDQRREYVQELLDNHNPYEEYLKLFLEFQEYVLFENLVKVLPKEKDIRSINRFKKSARFWALDDAHILKKEIKQKFPTGHKIPVIQCKDKISGILKSLFDYEITSQSDATKKLRLFCNLGDKDDNRLKDAEHGRYFMIKSYDPLGFDCDPLKRMPQDTPVQYILEL